MFTWPFDPTVPHHCWTSIPAAGFDQPVPGCVYTGSRLDGGVPLGGLGTGYLTLEGTGKIGWASIYNDIVPPRRFDTEWLSIRVGQVTMPLSTAAIHYWGHYPVADLVAELPGCPLTLGIRALSPFIVGDAAASNMPAALFELALHNDGPVAVDAEITVAFPTPPAAGQGPHARITTALAGDGFAVNAEDGNGTGKITLHVPPGSTGHARCVFAWHAPYWRDSGNEPHVHRYAQRYTTAEEVIADAWARFDSLAGRVLAWQGVVYAADLPAWLRDALIQGLYSLAKNTVWIARTRRDEWWGDDGWFSHSESHTGCPITETMVCRMHGHFPALFFFPGLETTTLDAFRHFQIADGEIPFSYGMTTSLHDPRYHCQHPLNSGQYAQMVYRLYRRTGDLSLLQAFYPSARQAIRYLYTLDDDGDGLVNEQAHVAPGEHWPANQFYDIWPWWGTSAYVAGTWLATLACGQAMAAAVGDEAFAAECAEWLARGQSAYDEKLWTGAYYRLWNNCGDTVGDQAGELSDVSLGNQLMVQWCAKVAGLDDLLPEDKVQSALRTVASLNMAATAYGLVNGVTPSGDRFDAGHPGENDHAKHVFVGENLCAAMTFLYHGREAEGLAIAERIYTALALRTCAPWNQRCLIHADTGLPIWGDDYYSNLVVWALPMAVAKQDIASFTAPHGLIDRIIRAGGA